MSADNFDQKWFDALTLEESSNARLTFVYDFFDFSKIEAGHIEPEQQPFDLSDVVESARIAPPATISSQAVGSVSSGAISNAELSDRMPLRILIAEDMVVNQKLLQGMLGAFGYRADIAGNGLEALHALERQSYDVILMDIRMPEMDGLEATRQIVRRYEPQQRPYIVAVTANATREDRDVCLKAGMDDYLTKPLKLETLRTALVRCAEERISQGRILNL